MENCFIEGNFYSSNDTEIKVSSLNLFCKSAKIFECSKKRILINNLWSRLDRIERYKDKLIDDDLPF